MCISKDGGTFPLFTEDWTSEEEVLLLDAIEQHGFGNWYVNSGLPDLKKNYKKCCTVIL